MLFVHGCSLSRSQEKKSDPTAKEYSPSLTYAIVRTFFWPIVLAAGYRLLNDVVTFASPQILRYEKIATSNSG